MERGIHDRDGRPRLATPRRVGHLPSDEAVRTVGAILIYGGRLVVSVGPHRRTGGNGVVRLGGRRQAGETAAECVRREVAEEASVDTAFITPPATMPVTASSMGSYLLGGPQPTVGEPAPLFVDQGETGDGPFHLTYVLHATSAPAPSAECRALLHVTVGELRELCERPWITSVFLRSRGRIQLAGEIDGEKSLAAFGPPLWFAAATRRYPTWERALGLVASER